MAMLAIEWSFKKNRQGQRFVWRPFVFRSSIMVRFGWGIIAMTWFRKPYNDLYSYGSHLETGNTVWKR